MKSSPTSPVDYEHDHFAVTLQSRGDFQVDVDFDQAGVPGLVLDEPPPLGAGAGPNAARVLAAAVGHCLGASLTLCLRKAHIDLEELRVDVSGTFERNPRGRLRIASLAVTLQPDVPAEQRERMGRCLQIFEDFCIVTQSVRQGIDVQVSVAQPVKASSY